MFKEPTTLYYFFSTLAQVIAAVTALIAVLVHFRISALRDFLVGDGEAVLRRKKDYNNSKGYEILTEDNKDSLQDAVYRKDIVGIRRILNELAIIEENKNINKDHHGFQWLFGFYTETENQIIEMSRTSKYSFVSALFTALYSVFAILFIELSNNNNCFQIILISLNIILVIICGYFLINGIRLAFKNFTNRFE